MKKCRTSSDSLEEVRIVALVPPEATEDLVAHQKRFTTPEVDPDGEQWDDLDAEDADDPLMVSEYVHEIFEVSEAPAASFYHLPPTSRKR